MPQANYRVRATHCDHSASDKEVYEALKRATDPLQAAWATIRKARRITLKMNQVWPPELRLYVDGQPQEIVASKVARATLRLLRESNPSAEILCPETSPEARLAGRPLSANVAHVALLKEFDVTLIKADNPPLETAVVPGGGSMFRQYLLHESVVDTDALVSVSKMKNHAFMGVTLCLKNLFGLPPQTPFGRSRAYFHHIIRLPHVLVDLGLLTRPALNIIDGLVGQSGREWGGEGRVGDVLVAGDQVIATDACGMYLMGFDPLSDWPRQPFVRDPSAILVGHHSGFGTADLARIDYQSEVDAPVASFRTVETDPPAAVLAWRRSTCEQCSRGDARPANRPSITAITPRRCAIDMQVSLSSCRTMRSDGMTCGAILLRAAESWRAPIHSRACGSSTSIPRKSKASTMRFTRRR